jgi:uncharacterized small protein (DUF1192 family)
MDEDENKAKRIAQYVIGQDLSELSVDEISETIEALEIEIDRLKTAQSEKSDHLSAAAALFKS